MSKSTILNCENRIFRKSLSICHKTIFLETWYCFCLFIVPYHANISKKILRSHHENLAQTAIFPIWKFFGKFKCYIYPRFDSIMLLKISQILIEWIMTYKVPWIWGNLIQLPYKEFFFFKKNDCYFLFIFCVLSFT